jgi:hypothetical protein
MIKLEAYLDGFSSKKDKSAGLRFSTQELAPDMFATLQQENGSFGWLLFSPNAISETDIPTAHAEDKLKTPSKRLRSVLYIFWEQKGKPTGNFETFYSQEMDKIVEHIKTKLD